MKKFVSMLMMIAIMFTNINVKAASIPTLHMVTQPKSEYTEGDRISFTVTSPNYSGKVEYRVILWNGTTKKTSELWKTHKGYYYQNWKPAGNYKFTINWPVKGMESGAYSLTVLVRRAGAKVPYDSYTKTNSFWIRRTNSSDIPIMGINESKSKGKYVPVLKFDSDKYIGKYCNSNVSNMLFGETGTVDMSLEFGDIRIRHLFNLNSIGHFYSKDSNDECIIVPRDCVRGGKSDYFSVEQNDKVIDGTSHIYALLICEIGYDNTRDKYYITNTYEKDYVDGRIEMKPHTCGNKFRYFAIPLFCAD